MVTVAGVSIAVAPNRCVGTIECDLARADEFSATTTTIAPSTTVTATAVATSVAGETTVPSTAAPTTLPPPEVPYFALGESVMKGAVPNLEAAGIRTDAQESRQARTVRSQHCRRSAARTGSRKGSSSRSGTNSPVSRAQYETILAELSDLNLVVMMTVKAPGQYIQDNNAIIRSLPDTHPNVKVLDWEARGAEVEDGLSRSDGGIHLVTAEAKTFYTDARPRGPRPRLTTPFVREGTQCGRSRTNGVATRWGTWSGREGRSAR